MISKVELSNKWKGVAMKQEYKSVKLNLGVYKKADYLKAINKKEDGKCHSLSSIIDKGLDLIINIKEMEKK